jgi:hypothetical protein
MATKSSSTSVQANDDTLTVCAISILAGILTNVLREGLGHAATALVTGAKSGVLTRLSRGPATSTRGLLPRRGPWRTSWPPLFSGLHCAEREADRFDCVFFCLRALLSTSLLALDISSFRRHEFWRLGNGGCRPALALVVADTPHGGRNSGLVWGSIGPTSRKELFPSSHRMELTGATCGSTVAAALSVVFIFVLGRGITLRWILVQKPFRLRQIGT